MEYQQLIADIQYQLQKIEFCRHIIKYGINIDVAKFEQKIKLREKIIEELKISLKSVL